MSVCQELLRLANNTVICDGSENRDTGTSHAAGGGSGGGREDFLEGVMPSLTLKGELGVTQAEMGQAHPR